MVASHELFFSTYVEFFLKTVDCQQIWTQRKKQIFTVYIPFLDLFSIKPSFLGIVKKEVDSEFCEIKFSS